MKSRILILLVLSQLITSTSIAQKRWDGEAADGEWNSGRNWYPDGIPADTDLVLLNNDFINTSYNVRISGSSISVICSSITIMPSAEGKIVLEIAETNTVSPALITNDIIIEKGGELINCSGALSGNTFQINGNIIIRNEGRYVHQTIRGNAYLISKLIHQKGTEKGIIAFNVPGNSGYLLSLSGRTFGTLHLGKHISTQSKSYNGSGINNLVISGDLIIDENVSLKSSLTGNMHIKGNITNHGSCVMAPSTADTSKRMLLIDGDSMVFINSGIFEQNNNFNGITVSPGTNLKLNSSLTLSNPNSILNISRHAIFDPGDYYLQGGKFYSDSMSTILVTSTDGISSQPNKGNIRGNQIRMNSKSSVIFCGVGNQQSGDLFPDTLGAVTIDKTIGHIILSRNLHITDSLILKKGNIISSDISKIGFSGHRILPNELLNIKTASAYQGFIEGPFKYYSDSSTEVSFPIGKEGIYAPISIVKDKAVPIAYDIEYFNKKSIMYDSTKTYPLYKIDSSQYWKVEIINQGFSTETTSSICLNANLNIMGGRYNEQCLAYFEYESNKWNNIFLPPQNENSDIQTSAKFLLDKGLITFGQIQFNILPISALSANAHFVNSKVEVSWQDEKNTETIQYRIETSDDSRIFMPIGMISNQRKSENQPYKFQFIPKEPATLYIRICAIDSFYKQSYSNIIHLKNHFQVKPLFPNPATNEIYLVLDKDDEKIDYWIIDATGKEIKPIVDRRGNIFIFRIESLFPGSYILQCESKGLHKSYPFIKK
jgi:hypothetical protein